jgi:hypothetical protein
MSEEFVPAPADPVSAMSAASTDPTGAVAIRTAGSHSTDSSAQRSTVVYPESDGKPMAENETQLFLMMALIAHLRARFGGPSAHVGGDMFWYPVEGQPDIVRAPDVFVAFGRPQDPERRSWKQWEESNHPLDLVIEVVSPTNHWHELARLLTFYETHGVREYVVLDPEAGRVDVFRRIDDHLVACDGVITSELAQLRFEAHDAMIDVFDLALGRVLAPHELHALAAAEQSRGDNEFARAEREAARVDHEAARVSALEARLREVGIDPSEVS